MKLQEVLELVKLDSTTAAFDLPQDVDDFLVKRTHHRLEIDLGRWNELGRPARLTVTLEKHS